MAEHWKRLGLVGYGEVGRIFSSGLKDHFDVVSAWDVKFPGDTSGSRTAAAAAGVQAVQSMQALCAQSDLVISAVTASNALAVAQAAAPHLRAGMVFLDLNSASPGTKQQAAQLVEARAPIVEAGVMTSVAMHQGAHAVGWRAGASPGAMAQPHGMDVKPVAAKLGGVRHQDVPQRDDQGLEALVIRLQHRACLRGRRPCAHAGRDFSID